MDRISWFGREPGRFVMISPKQKKPVQKEPGWIFFYYPDPDGNRSRKYRTTVFSSQPDPDLPEKTDPQFSSANRIAIEFLFYAAYVR